MTDEWIYERSADNSARFVLGTVGANPLVCVGVNPSTAEPGDPDPTVRKLMGFADRNGYDSWVKLNLYPQRSTDPKGMHVAYCPELQAENEHHIAVFINDRPLTLLAAWGEPIEKRPYLLEMLEGIVDVTQPSSCDWISIGELLKSGHLRHPSRASYTLPMQPFDMDQYLATRRAHVTNHRQSLSRI